ncbi:hypothetical protein F2P81_007932 [Scophthalmus maximus]|uniref:Uncharacterized protein n=1 Tax=Scophthalmus maximus TaxID=52904 RepID=A0A6A4T0Y3_SCOMX|nr:hypothetical protein F2P81_007932 [Scophthalmus maximus]
MEREEEKSPKTTPGSRTSVDRCRRREESLRGLMANVNSDAVYIYQAVVLRIQLHHCSQRGRPCAHRDDCVSRETAVIRFLHTQTRTVAARGLYPASYESGKHPYIQYVEYFIGAAVFYCYRNNLSPDMAGRE